MGEYRRENRWFHRGLILDDAVHLFANCIVDHASEINIKLVDVYQKKFSTTKRKSRHLPPDPHYRYVQICPAP
ncbi:10149_t:CDS:1, partial [Acaulospora colombiana]